MGKAVSAIITILGFYGVLVSGGGLAKAICASLITGGMCWFALVWESKPQNQPTKKEELIYVDDKGEQYRLSAEQYGNLCVIWAQNAEKLATLDLEIYGKVRINPDIIAKISKNPQLCKKYAVAFFVAVYCCYPVIRLGVSNDFFNGILRGVKNKILLSGQLLNESPTHTIDYQNLVSEVSQYTATLLEMAGMEYEENNDHMYLGVSGVCKKLFLDLEMAYVGLKLENFIPYSLPEGQYDDALANPLINKSRSIDQKTLIRNVFAYPAKQFIKATDENRNLLLIK